MITPFQQALSDIKSLENYFLEGDERRTREKVIDRLLALVGWDIASKDVHRECPLSQSGYADYALKIDGEIRVIIEAKRWGRKLWPRFEQKLRDYCNAAGKKRPPLAILTNGQQWRFYIAPVKNRLGLKLFLDLNIVGDKVDKLEKGFGEFLSRDRISAMNAVPSRAYILREALINDIETMNKLAKHWNLLLKSLAKQEGLLSQFASISKIETSPEQIERFRTSNVLLFNPAFVPPVRNTSQRPDSFTFRPNGEEPIPLTLGLAECIRKLCVLLYERHPSDFRERILAINETWVSEERDRQPRHYLIRDSGVAVLDKDSAKEKLSHCRRLLEQFGYTADSLIIHYPDEA